MGFSTSISRFADYLRRNGFRATIRRIGLASQTLAFFKPHVLFYCDLSALSLQAAELPRSIKVERKKAKPISARDLEQITRLWNPKLASDNTRGRFGLGASLVADKF